MSSATTVFSPMENATRASGTKRWIVSPSIPNSAVTFGTSLRTRVMRETEKVLEVVLRVNVTSVG
jgi:hypothetical protein